MQDWLIGHNMQQLELMDVRPERESSHASAQLGFQKALEKHSNDLEKHSSDLEKTQQKLNALRATLDFMKS